MKTSALILLVTLSSGAFGQATSNPANAVLNGTIALAMSMTKKTEAEVSADILAGSCSYQGSNCNGAKVTLFDGDQRLQERTLTSGGEFRFTNLKKKYDYVLELSWPGHRFLERQKVTSGSFYSFDLRDR